MLNNFEELEKLRERLLNLQETFSSEIGEVDYDDILKEMDVDLEQIEKDISEGATKLDLPYQILHTDEIHPKYNYDSDIWNWCKKKKLLIKDELSDENGDFHPGYFGHIEYAKALSEFLQKKELI
jgi:hypothetical protein